MKKAAIGIMLAALFVIGGCVSQEDYNICMADKEKLAGENEKMTTEMETENAGWIEALQKMTAIAGELESQRDAYYEENEKLKEQMEQNKQKMAETLKALLDAQLEVKKLQQQVSDSQQAMAKTADMMTQLQQALDAAKAEIATLKTPAPAKVE